ncbi:mRNA splicing protein prp18 [Tulasnella sp. 403]|nr:mRNA splicing protein prp18 [Tulasnella sp. 403]
MDFLKAELAGKRKALESEASRPKKYMRRGEIEQLKAEEERKQRAEAEKARIEAEAKAKSKAVESLKAAEARNSRSISPAAPPVEEGASSSNPSAFNISNEEAIRRLRAKGQPIRLFGESDKDRRLRLRALELIEENDTAKEGAGGLNDFKRLMAGMEEGLDAKEAERRLLSGAKAASPAADGSGNEKDVKGKRADRDPKGREGKATEVLDLSLIQTDPKQLYPLVYRALKDVLQEWAEAMDQREEHVKRTTQGKHAAATQVASAEYLKPLFRNLKQRTLPADVLSKLAEIVHYMQKRQYQRANDAYLRLSIGNAAWPIGVTMVGIHERSAREKISSDQVAHVLNDEVSRKYIQSVKRPALSTPVTLAILFPIVLDYPLLLPPYQVIVMAFPKPQHLFRQASTSTQSSDSYGSDHRSDPYQWEKFDALFDKVFTNTSPAGSVQSTPERPTRKPSIGTPGSVPGQYDAQDGASSEDSRESFDKAWDDAVRRTKKTVTTTTKRRIIRHTPPAPTPEPIISPIVPRLRYPQAPFASVEGSQGESSDEQTKPSFSHRSKESRHRPEAAARAEDMSQSRAVTPWRATFNLDYGHLPVTEIVSATFEMPTELKKEDIRVTFTNTLGAEKVTVAWEHVDVAEIVEDGKLVRERKERRYHRQLPLPKGVKFQNVQAHLHEGVLTITYPRPAQMVLGRPRLQLTPH